MEQTIQVCFEEGKQVRLEDFIKKVKTGANKKAALAKL